MELVKWSAQYFRLSWVEGFGIWNFNSCYFLAYPKKNVILLEIN